MQRAAMSRLLGRHGLSRGTRAAIEGYLCVLPWLFGFVALTLGPMLASLYLSFHYSVFRPHRATRALENYLRASKVRTCYSMALWCAQPSLPSTLYP